MKYHADLKLNQAYRCLKIRRFDTYPESLSAAIRDFYICVDVLAAEWSFYGRVF